MVLRFAACAVLRLGACGKVPKRHCLRYRFVDAVEGSVAFIISQDGIIEACTKHDGKVIVYDNVALPLL